MSSQQELLSQYQELLAERNYEVSSIFGLKDQVIHDGTHVIHHR